MQRFYWSEDQNDGNAIERCAPSGRTDPVGYGYQRRLVMKDDKHQI